MGLGRNALPVEGPYVAVHFHELAVPFVTWPKIKSTYLTLKQSGVV